MSEALSPSGAQEERVRRLNEVAAGLRNDRELQESIRRMHSVLKAGVRPGEYEELVIVNRIY